MPYSDPAKARESQRERSKRYRTKRRTEKYGPNAPDMRGRHNNHRSGSAHPRWSGYGVSEHGYAKIPVGIGHPLADPNGYAYVHHLVWASAGRQIPEGQVIHHVNEDTLDNRIANLALLSRAGHNRLHSEDIVRDPKSGRFVGKKAAGRLLDGREHNELPR